MEVWVNPSDRLKIISYASVASTLDVIVRIRQPETQGGNNGVPGSDPPVMVRGFKHTTNTARTANEETFDINFEGLMDACSVDVASNSAGSPLRGQVFCKLGLERGNTIVPIAQGYVSMSNALMMGESESSLSGQGYIYTVANNPAAGAQLSQSIPTGARWKPIALRIVLITDATVADRNMRLNLDDGTSNFVTYITAVNQTATQTRNYVWYIGADREDDFVNIEIHYPLPHEYYMGAGWRIRTSITNLQAGDDIDSAHFLIEEWLEAA